MDASFRTSSPKLYAASRSPCTATANKLARFQYVDDLVAGLMALMDNENEIGPVNIGNPGEFTMIELAEVVKEVVNKNAKIEFKENTADDPGRRKPDITLAKTALGWEPKITLREGLPKMVEDFRERFSWDDKREL